MGYFRISVHTTTSCPVDQARSALTISESKYTSRQLYSPSMTAVDVIVASIRHRQPSCPCCKQNLKDEKQVVGETERKLYGCIFDDDGDETESCSSFDDTDDESSMKMGVFSCGTPYMTTNKLHQGWVHKKGSGRDWARSIGWKPRWAVLSVSA
jgi:hypothetical protein